MLRAVPFVCFAAFQSFVVTKFDNNQVGIPSWRHGSFRSVRYATDISRMPYRDVVHYIRHSYRGGQKETVLKRINTGGMIV